MSEVPHVQQGAYLCDRDCCYEGGHAHSTSCRVCRGTSLIRNGSDKNEAFLRDFVS